MLYCLSPGGRLCSPLLQAALPWRNAAPRVNGSCTWNSLSEVLLASYNEMLSACKSSLSCWISHLGLCTVQCCHRLPGFPGCGTVPVYDRGVENILGRPRCEGSFAGGMHATETTRSSLCAWWRTDRGFVQYTLKAAVTRWLSRHDCNLGQPTDVVRRPPLRSQRTPLRCL